VAAGATGLAGPGVSAAVAGIVVGPAAYNAGVASAATRAIKRPEAMDQLHARGEPYEHSKSEIGLIRVSRRPGCATVSPAYEHRRFFELALLLGHCNPLGVLRRRLQLAHHYVDRLPEHV